MKKPVYDTIDTNWESRQYWVNSVQKGGPCKFCGIIRRTLHQDHIIPISQNGLSTPENLQYICANCHQDKTYEDHQKYPRKSPAQRLTKALAKSRRKGAGLTIPKNRGPKPKPSPIIKDRRLATPEMLAKLAIIEANIKKEAEHLEGRHVSALPDRRRRRT